MTRSAWPAELTYLTGKQVRHYREKRGMSAERLAEAIQALGLPYTRSQVTNLESGRRTTITAGEVLALAKVLGEPPLLLLFPVESGSELLEVLPGKEMGVWAAAKWFTGEGPFLTRLGDEWAAETGDEGGASLAYRREQDELFRQWSSAQSQLAAAERRLDRATSEEGEAVARRLVEANRAVVREVEAALGHLRQVMRRDGIDPGGLTPNLQHVDDDDVAKRHETTIRKRIRGL